MLRRMEFRWESLDRESDVAGKVSTSIASDYDAEHLATLVMR